MVGTPHWFDTHMPGTVTGLGPESERAPVTMTPDSLGDAGEKGDPERWVRLDSRSPATWGQQSAAPERKSRRRRRTSAALPAALRAGAGPAPSLIEGVSSLHAGSLEPDGFRDAAQDLDWNAQVRCCRFRSSSCALYTLVSGVAAGTSATSPMTDVAPPLSNPLPLTTYIQALVHGTRLIDAVPDLSLTRKASLAELDEYDIQCMIPDMPGM